jgi:dTMP kinase
MKGKFITLEGGEGSGKSTQAKLLADALKKKGYSVVLTKEPGSTVSGAKIREILLSPETKKLCPEAETFLFMADRAQHISEIVRPALEQGKIVVSDRHGDSTLAYQGYGRGLDKDMIKKMSLFATHDLRPDLTLVLDVSAKQGLERASAKAEFSKRDRIESEKIEFHHRIAEGFRKIAGLEPGRVKLIPHGSIEHVHKEIMKHVEKILD